MTDRWTPSQLTGTLRWVLSLEYAGGTWYLGQESITIDDGTGGTIVISDGLLDLADTTETLDLWSTDSPRRSVPVEFDLGVDVATLIEQGHDLAGCVAELAQLADGDDWSARRPFVLGRLQEPQYGADGEGVRASIEQDVLTDETTIEPLVVRRSDAGPAASLVTGHVFDPVEAAVFGDDVNAAMTIPVVLGTPGSGASPGTRAVRLRFFQDSATLDWYNYWLIAGHAVEATSVTLQAIDGSQLTFTVQQATLSTGEVFAFIADNLTAGGWTNSTEEATVLWTTGGGLVDQNYGALRYGGDYVAWLLSLTEQDVDHARVNLAREQLRAYKIATYLDEAVTVAEYIREVVLDILPVSMTVGPRGVYPYVWRWDATSEDAVAHFDATEDPDIEREGLVTYEDADKVENTVQLLYGWTPREESYTSEMWAVGDPASRPRGLRFGGGSSLSRSYWTDGVLAKSVARYGVKRAALESAIVHDDLTATQVLAWRSRRWALPSRVVEYTCPQRWAWIEPGDFVTVTDPELAWSERLCLVQSRAWASDGSVRYTLRVQEG